jgi:hypothetical protein
MFTDKQLAELRAPLNRANVKEREQGGRKLSYVEGWHCEAEANRIFGEHAWDSVVIDLRCVSERQRKIGKGQYEKDGWGVTYVATVRVTVTTPDGKVVTRDGVGAGHGIDADCGLAHESAIKEAATDAEKRGLKTFGNPFGLALYDKTQANVADAPPVDPENCPAVTAAKVAIDMCGDLTALKRWHAENIAALEMLPGDQFDAVARHYKAKGAEFRAQQQKEAA